MPGKEVHCCKSARICKGKIILIRHNYFSSNINSGSCCTNMDTANSQSLSSEEREHSRAGARPDSSHMGWLSHTVNITNPLLVKRQKSLLLSGHRFRFRKIKTVVNAVIFKSSICL